VKLLLAGHGGEGRMRLDVMSVVGTYCSGIWDWRYYIIFPISCLPDVLEKDISSHPSGWALLRCSKPIVTIVAAVTRWCLKICASGSCTCTWVVTMRTMGLMVLWKYDVRSFLQKSENILSFIIGFAIVEIPSVVI
jgi:hypothetical protein